MQKGLKKAAFKKKAQASVGEKRSRKQASHNDQDEDVLAMLERTADDAAGA